MLFLCRKALTAGIEVAPSTFVMILWGIYFFGIANSKIAIVNAVKAFLVGTANARKIAETEIIRR